MVADFAHCTSMLQVASKAEEKAAAALQAEQAALASKQSLEAQVETLQQQVGQLQQAIHQFKGETLLSKKRLPSPRYPLCLVPLSFHLAACCQPHLLIELQPIYWPVKKTSQAGAMAS